MSPPKRLGGLRAALFVFRLISRLGEANVRAMKTKCTITACIISC